MSTLQLARRIRGVGLAGVHRSTHFGCSSHYVMQAMLVAFFWVYIPGAEPIASIATSSWANYSRQEGFELQPDEKEIQSIFETHQFCKANWY